MTKNSDIRPAILRAGSQFFLPALFGVLPF
jgi:hypothetical protein